MNGTNMQPIYIKSFRAKEGYSKRYMTSYILSTNKNYTPTDEIKWIIHSYKNEFYVYVDKTVESYFNVWLSAWPRLKLEKIISISQYLKLGGFTLIDFSSLINLINVINNTHTNQYTNDLNNVLQLILAKWDDWN